MKRLILLSVVVLASCFNSDKTHKLSSIADIVEKYIVLELSMKAYDKAHIDAYSGPEKFLKIAKQRKLSLIEIFNDAEILITTLSNHKDSNTLRVKGLVARLTALQTRIKINQKQFVSFDEEAQLLFDSTPPTIAFAEFQIYLEQIAQLLSADIKDLNASVAKFKRQFIIPKAKLKLVFDEAIAECRRRTMQYINLPKAESFELEFVTDKSWSGYNWYQGDFHSLIQINTDLPIYIDRAVDLGCHEGYPGHHTYNVLIEKVLLQNQKWLEYSVYPLFSPQSLIAEGSANYGIKLAFPNKERLEYETTKLFPLAGLDSNLVEKYYQLERLLEQLSFVGNEVARQYLNKKIDKSQAVMLLKNYNLYSDKRAKQRVAFIDDYRSYVINYNVGQQIVKNYIETTAKTTKDKWQKFAELLVSAKTASFYN